MAENKNQEGLETTDEYNKIQPVRTFTYEEDKKKKKNEKKEDKQNG